MGAAIHWTSEQVSGNSATIDDPVEGEEAGVETDADAEETEG